jgi:hypothetical protein
MRQEKAEKLGTYMYVVGSSEFEENIILEQVLKYRTYSSKKLFFLDVTATMMTSDVFVLLSC